MKARHGLDREQFLDDGINALVAQDGTEDPVLGVAEGGLGLDGNSGVQVLPAMPPLSLVQVGWDAQESDLGQPRRAFSVLGGRRNQRRLLLNLPTGRPFRDVGEDPRDFGRFMVDPHGDDSTHRLIEACDAQFGRGNVGVVNVHVQTSSAGRPQRRVQ